ncbi:hypothetical protein D1953_00135 [Peribacillus asahii]|uniref:Virulence-associated protein E-like domain-containing protein n=1 Tax=Peribacillus asahii TaxID=228899 RepID=A0A398BG27_9BACI|nr:virulence-associated E family protein [Peribacillus asahii]RID89022.1 hypothetical protein D1953_00135 [Peribacillus asahii]
MEKSLEELSTLRKYGVDKALGLKNNMVFGEMKTGSHNERIVIDWKEQLQKSDNGKILSNAFNTLLILKNDENLKSKFAFNLFTQKIDIVGNVPWKRLGQYREITNHDDSCLRNYFSVHYGIKSQDIIFDALNEVVLDNQYHPVRDFLKMLKWDGKERLDSLLVDFFNADDTDLNRWQMRLTLVGAVARIFEPGCKFDFVLTIQGGQGIGKSTFFKELAVSSDWFSDSLDEIRGKDAKEHLSGNWIIELGEMAAVGKADQKRIKQFISSSEDVYRPPYGRRTIRVPRQCIFVATTNDDLPLKDDTGNRRWWIVKAHTKEPWFKKNNPLEVEQIWAEAVYQYEYMKANDIPLALPSNLEKQARRVQSDFTDKGEFASIIEEALDRGYTEERTQEGVIKVPINETCPMHVWEKVLKRYRDQYTTARGREIKAVLNSLGEWEQVGKGRVKFGEYGKQYVFRRKDREDR